MAKTSSIQKNDRRKRTVLKYAKLRKELKSILQDPKQSQEEKEAATLKLRALPRNASPIRVRNRCLISGRSRGFMRRFGISRIEFREAASRGFIPGLTKASW